jgi:hypothetical protein
MARWTRAEFVHRRSSPSVNALLQIAWRSFGQYSQSSSDKPSYTLIIGKRSSQPVIVLDHSIAIQNV